MDFLLGKVTQQAMNYAIRSGVTLTATYALKQSTRLLANAPKSNVSVEFDELQQVSYLSTHSSMSRGLRSDHCPSVFITRFALFHQQSI